MQIAALAACVRELKTSLVLQSSAFFFSNPGGSEKATRGRGRGKKEDRDVSPEVAAKKSHLNVEEKKI